MQTAEAIQNDQNTLDNQPNSTASPPPLSKNAQKKLLKQQKFEAKKAEKKASIKEQKKREAERKRKEWDAMLASVSEGERSRLIESRKGLRKERMEKRSEEREKKIERLAGAKLHGQNIVVDLEFADLMTPNEINSLVQQNSGAELPSYDSVESHPNIDLVTVERSQSQYLGKRQRAECSRDRKAFISQQQSLDDIMAFLKEFKEESQREWSSLKEEIQLLKKSQKVIVDLQAESMRNQKRYAKELKDVIESMNLEDSDEEMAGDEE